MDGGHDTAFWGNMAEQQSAAGSIAGWAGVSGDRRMAVGVTFPGSGPGNAGFSWKAAQQLHLSKNAADLLEILHMMGLHVQQGEVTCYPKAGLHVRQGEVTCYPKVGRCGRMQWFQSSSWPQDLRILFAAARLHINKICLHWFLLILLRNCLHIA